MVPYLGASSHGSWILASRHQVEIRQPFRHHRVVLTGIHVIAQNLIAPQLVGRQVRLNAVAITVALLSGVGSGEGWG